MTQLTESVEPPAVHDGVPAPAGRRDGAGGDDAGPPLNVRRRREDTVVGFHAIEGHPQAVHEQGEHFGVHPRDELRHRPLSRQIEPVRIGTEPADVEHIVMVRRAADVENLLHLDGVQRKTDPGGRSGDLLDDEPGIEAGAEKGRVPLGAGPLELGGIGGAVIGGEPMPVDRNDVLPRGQQAAHVRVVVAIGKLDARGVDDHVGLQGQDVLDPVRRDDARRRPPGDLTRVTADLPVAVDVKPHEFQIGMVDHGPQARFPHGARRPLNHAVFHRPFPFQPRMCSQKVKDRFLRSAKLGVPVYDFWLPAYAGTAGARAWMRG